MGGCYSLCSAIGLILSVCLSVNSSGWVLATPYGLLLLFFVCLSVNSSGRAAATPYGLLLVLFLSVCLLTLVGGSSLLLMVCYWSYFCLSVC